uniref:Uncharacterized protein n=1 Tax=viral metagenome TaxID=1070528 RepID=A0A6M3KUL8_9ZZZZ
MTWTEIVDAGGHQALVAFHKLWFTHEPLTEEEEGRLKDLYARFPLDNVNFKSWSKQRVRQLFEKNAQGQEASPHQEV